VDDILEHDAAIKGVTDVAQYSLKVPVRAPGNSHQDNNSLAGLTHKDPRCFFRKIYASTVFIAEFVLEEGTRYCAPGTLHPGTPPQIGEGRRGLG
jgi:hypothetical protein